MLPGLRLHSGCFGLAGIVLDLSVAQYDVAAAVLGYFRIVRDEDDGASFGMQLLEQYQNLERSTGIQITGELRPPG